MSKGPGRAGTQTKTRAGGSEVIADALLKRGYSARVAEKVFGANFIAAFDRIWS
jgi:microsomal dipeptidase-like Zn-dependent dipeptidase